MRHLMTVVVTAILVSAVWIFYGNITRSPATSDGKVAPAGDKAVVRPAGEAPMVLAESVTVGPAGLAIPVAGVKPSELTDTFTAARAGGARRHDAIDIMAAQGRVVIAAAPGTVEKLYNSVGKGGITAYIRSDDQLWTYYYAHLSAYAPGLHEGQRMRRGDAVGYVGYTGDASPDAPHLHFAINRMAPGERWWQGTPINPYPLLAGRSANR
ncbi:M23 family metallopeptidase [Sphingomonas rhizophila]|uniref:M23 family metallopeptidase n=1 Tax=Sphingomonas rhizophila TaxID=2071607 RepID=A0A7G9SDV8_9SPHN|nr:M23 family metallopeptidase [Sphingomonas rhizophila]QNN66033.1 M23 family metallopeptidase [Sphingomonas rhizophila]